MRQLNTTLWDLGASLEPTIRGDFDAWTPVMFPPPPPPAPPAPLAVGETVILLTSPLHHC